MIAEGLDQNVETLDPGDSILDENSYATERSVVSFLFGSEFRSRVVLAFAWSLMRYLHVLTDIIALDPLVSQVEQGMDGFKPGMFWGKLGFEHRVVVVMPRKGTPHEYNPLRQGCHNRVLHHVSFFLPLYKSCCSSSSAGLQCGR